MADDRIKDLSGEVATNQIQDLLDTLYLAADDTSFTDAKKMLLKTILTNSIVENNLNNYQALTPKGFYESVMTEVRLGIARLATDEEVTAGTEAGVLKSVHQALMKAQWKKDWWISGNAVPNIYHRNSDANMDCISWDCDVRTTLPQGVLFEVHPPLPADKKFLAITMQLLIGIGTVGGSALTPHGGFFTMRYTGNATQINIPRLDGLASFAYMIIQADGKHFGLQGIYATTSDHFISGKFTALLQSV